MKKIIVTLLIVFIVSSLMATNISAVETGPDHGKIPKVSGITIDCEKDAGYNNGLIIEFSRVSANYPDANIAQGDLKTTGALGKLTFVWDDGYLYAYAEVTDEHTGWEYTEDQFTASQTNMENIALIIDFVNDGSEASLFRLNYYNYLHYIYRTLNEAGTEAGVVVNNFILADAKDSYEMIGKETADGWAAEVKIPLNDLGAGSKIGIFCQLTDKDLTGANATPVHTGWSPHTDPTAGPWISPKYGFVELSADAVATQGITTPGAAVPVETPATPEPTPAPAEATPVETAPVEATPAPAEAAPVTAPVAPQTSNAFNIFILMAVIALSGTVIIITGKKKTSL